jgi:hypothetical protein
VPEPATARDPLPERGRVAVDVREAMVGTLPRRPQQSQWSHADTPRRTPAAPRDHRVGSGPPLSVPIDTMITTTWSRKIIVSRAGRRAACRSTR